MPPTRVCASAGCASGYLSGVVAIAAGQFSFVALKSDGTVWAWGWNPDEMMGQSCGWCVGISINGAPAACGCAWLPVQVQCLSGVRSIALNNGKSGEALLSDGSVDTWGADDKGQLGVGSCCNATGVPAPVGGSCATPLAGITQVSAGYMHMLALRNDGTVRAWGENTPYSWTDSGTGATTYHGAGGDLGDGTTTAPARCRRRRSAAVDRSPGCRRSPRVAGPRMPSSTAGR